MLSCDSSYDSSLDSEAAEVEVEYDLEVEGSSNPSEHETSDDQPDAYANEPIADEEWLAQYEEERKTEEERYGMKRNTFCLTWLIFTAENNAFIWHFQDF